MGDDPTAHGGSPAILGRLRLSPLIALASVVGFGFATGETTAQGLSIISVGAMAGAGAFIFGALGGFLFGLPKTVATTDDPDDLVVPNANLDEISDWLTKILVGLGLVQLGEISDRLGKIANSLAAGIGGGDAAEAFALSLILYSLAVGFLLTYLWTRMHVTVGLFATARYLKRRARVLGRKLDRPPTVPAPPPSLAQQQAPAPGNRPADGE